MLYYKEMNMTFCSQQFLKTLETTAALISHPHETRTRSGHKKSDNQSSMKTLLKIVQYQNQNINTHMNQQLHNPYFTKWRAIFNRLVYLNRYSPLQYLHALTYSKTIIFTLTLLKLIINYIRELASRIKNVYTVDLIGLKVQHYNTQLFVIIHKNIQLNELF